MTEIETIVTDRMVKHRNSVLTSQIQKALPYVMSFERRDSLHVALQEISDKELLKDPDFKRKQTVFQLSRNSIYTSETIIDEYVIPGTEETLLSNSFARKLPVPIADKRIVRKSISLSFKRKSWYTKLRDYFEKKGKDFLYFCDLWHDALETIEGQHGTAVVSYFLFIRWLVYMNIIIFLLHFVFLVMPHMLFTGTDSISINHTSSEFVQIASITGELLSRNLKEIYYHNRDQLEKFNILNLPVKDQNHPGNNIINTTSVDVISEHCQTLYVQLISNDTQISFLAALQGTGPLERTHLFSGFYSPLKITLQGHVYDMSNAFLCVFLATFVTCLFMMMQYSAIGIQEAFISRSKQSTYSNDVFSRWEFCIKEPKSADRLHCHLVLEMKTNLNEDRLKRHIAKRSTLRRVKLYTIRFFVNIFILTWLCSCCYFIYSVATIKMREQNEGALPHRGFEMFFLQFSPSIIIVTLNIISATVFRKLASFEKYSAQTETNVSILRMVVLYLSSIIVLIHTFYYQVICKAKDICGVGLDKTCRSPRCWETYVGQQLYKLTLTNMFIQIGVFLCDDVLKYYVYHKFTRLCGFPQFSLSVEILQSVNSQAILWLGVFYSPLLPALMIFNFIIIFYIKKTKVLKFCEPPESPYRTSRINSIFSLILFISFFVALIVQSFVIQNVPPSRGCGSFRYLNFMTEAVPENIRSWLSATVSYWSISLVFIILCMIINYYWGILVFEKELSKRLRAHLVLQSYDKQFLLKSIAELTKGKSPSKVYKTGIPYFKRK